ncbi:hypothetical protein L584_20300 [Pantoea agglomerans Tx10]|nr:hypothetical protein L584_20300 [Pantoea agglomerans Tx10]
MQQSLIRHNVLRRLSRHTLPRVASAVGWLFAPVNAGDKQRRSDRLSGAR